MSRPHSPELELRILPQGVTATLEDGRRSAAEADLRSPQADLRATVLAALAGLPKDVPLRRAHAVVDNDLCWLDVVEGDFAAMTQAVIAQVARASVIDALGGGLDKHELRWQVQRDGRHLIVLAMPRLLIESLGAAVDERGIRLDRIDAALVDAWNRLDGSSPLQHGVLACVQDGRAMLARVHRRALTAIGREFVACNPCQLNDAAMRLFSRLGDEFGPETPSILMTDAPWQSKRLGAWRLLPLSRAAQEVPA